MTAKRYTQPIVTPMNGAHDPNKITMKLHKGRLCCWSGNVQRWIHEDASGEVSVDGVPCADNDKGHVPATRIVVHKGMIIPNHQLLHAGFTVVMNRRELPEGIREIV